MNKIRAFFLAIRSERLLTQAAYDQLRLDEHNALEQERINRVREKAYFLSDRAASLTPRKHSI